MSGGVLLLGAGPGLATSGLLYLGTYLRRHGVAATVRPLDTAPSLDELRRRVEAQLALTQPAVVAVSLKWFLHIHRALYIASVVKSCDPGIRVVLGGDTASHYYEELLAFDCVDHVVRGDGEAPLLAIARGLDHPNAFHRGKGATPLVGLGGLYAQRKDADDSFLSDLDALFVCESDRFYVSPFVVGGKGCSQACLYCGGARTAQTTNFGRKKSFMRPVDHVRRDIAELLPRVPCLVYDFSDHPLSDPTAELRALWSDLDLSRSGILYYAWRVPPPDFVELLASTHETVTLGLDFGCFSERQRAALVAEHVLKPLPADAEFLGVIEECTRYDNVRVRVSGVAGLPRILPRDLDAEAALIDRLLSYDIVEDVLFDRVHAQPGAPVLDALPRFGMRSPVKTFQDFLSWSEAHAPNGEYVPALLEHAPDASGAAVNGGDLDRAVAGAHGKIKEVIAETLARRSPAATFTDLPALSPLRLRRARRSRVLNRYTPRDWWLPSERPSLPEAALDEEQARVVIGHVWQQEFGALSMPAVVADYVVAAFDQPILAGEALTNIRARNAAIDDATYVGLVSFLYERGILEAAT